mmetsp:Transcript_16469/g.34790  ORF Transcript_16469/g.34790 Transcript_16469/m.34790 type:complete len:369 (+) Transcript_16469:489-1595(+)
MGITTTATCLLTLTKSTIAPAIAATPLLVTKGGGAITPLISSSPGMGIMAMPGMRGIWPSQVGGLPNRGAMYFALSLFVITALLRSAGDGYVHFMHFMAKHLGQMINKDEKDDMMGSKEIEIGLPKEVDWGTYSHSALDPLQKKMQVGNTMGSSYEFDKRTMLFEPLDKETQDYYEVEDSKLEKASHFFQEQQYKQHHHPVHVTRSKYETPNYLDSLSINEGARHDVPKGYLDTLNNAKASTWDAYKHQLEEAKPTSEIDELKEEVSTLHSLMQIEQSMYQTSNQALKLTMDAQNEELHHSSNVDELKDFDTKLSTSEELKEFDKKAQEFKDTVGKDATKVAKKNNDDSKKTNRSSRVFRYLRLVPEE